MLERYGFVAVYSLLVLLYLLLGVYLLFLKESRPVVSRTEEKVRFGGTRKKGVRDLGYLDFFEILYREIYWILGILQIFRDMLIFQYFRDFRK